MTMRLARNIVDGLVVPIGIVMIVWWLAAAWIGNPVILASPLKVFEALYGAARSGELIENLAVSMSRLVVALAAAIVVGTMLGAAMALNATVHDALDPIVELLRPISGIAWIPVALVLFGIGNALPVFIMFYIALFPIILNTLGGVSRVDTRLVDAARSFGVPELIILRRVIFPAALPDMMVGIRIGTGVCWTGLVAAELVGAPSGLGFAIEWYRGLLMTANVIGYIAVISALGFLTDKGFRTLQRRLTPWAPNPNA